MRPYFYSYSPCISLKYFVLESSTATKSKIKGVKGLSWQYGGFLLYLSIEINLCLR